MSTHLLSKGEAIRKIALDAIEKSKGRTDYEACLILRSSLEAIAVAATIEVDEK